MYLTIPGFESLTAQQVFDLSVAHIASTRTKSLDPTDSDRRCIYSGSGCAAAPFLREECRKEADDATRGGWRILMSKGLVPGNNDELITLLQNAHDRTQDDQPFMPQWKAHMIQVAGYYELSTTELDKVPA